jgi:sugar phosphate isomerase/epimerase
MQPIPIVGAAIPSYKLHTHLEWILSAQRDLEIQDAVDPHCLDGNWRERTQLIRGMLAGYTGRLGIHGPFHGLDIGCGDPAIQAVVQRRLLQGLEFAGQIGAKQMVVHSPFMNFGTGFSAVTPKSVAHIIEHARHTLAPVVTLASHIGCTLVIETIQDLNPRVLREFVLAFESPWVQHSIDVGHVRIGMTRGGASITEWIRQNGDILRHVHLQDTDGTYDWHHRLGLGDINFAAIFAELQQLPHQPRIILEMRNHDDIAASWQYLVERGLAK